MEQLTLDDKTRRQTTVGKFRYSCLYSNCLRSRTGMNRRRGCDQHSTAFGPPLVGSTLEIVATTTCRWMWKDPNANVKTLRLYGNDMSHSVKGPLVHCGIDNTISVVNIIVITLWTYLVLIKYFICHFSFFFNQV